MTNEDIIAIVEQTRAFIQNDHFIFTSGRHSSSYFNKDAIYPHTDAIATLCGEMAQRLTERGVVVDAVVGPALGGIVLSQWVAHHLTKRSGHEVLGIYTEKTPENGQRFTRGYDALVAGKRVLVVEDVMTTGGSVRKVIDAVRGAGGTVAHVSALLNRHPGVITSETIGASLSTLLELTLEDFDPAACPLCAKGIPINMKIGKGKELAPR